MGEIPVLLPIRDAQPMISIEKIKISQSKFSQDRNKPLPYIPLTTSRSQAQILGRHDFLLTMGSACPCLVMHPTKNSYRVSCPLCKAHDEWFQYVSLEFIQLELCSTDDDWNWRLVPIGKYANIILRINQNKLDACNTLLLKIGSTISLICPPMLKEKEQKKLDSIEFLVALAPVSTDSHTEPCLFKDMILSTPKVTKIDSLYASEMSKSTEDDIVSFSPSLPTVSLEKSTTTTTKSTTTTTTVYLLALGRTMSTSRIPSLKERVEKEMTNCKVLSSFDLHQPPHIIVVGNDLKATHVSTHLGFATIEDFSRFLQKHTIRVVLPEWITNKKRAIDEPTFSWPSTYELPWGLCFDGTYEIQGGVTNKVPSFGWVKRSPKPCEMKALSFIKASHITAPMVQSALKRRQALVSMPSEEPKRIRCDTAPSTYPINLELSMLMDQISSLYAECPVEKGDEWRSYSYKIISGRLRYLDFEVQNLPSILKKLKQINGFGEKVIKYIEEYLIGKECSLIQQLKNDGLRSALRNINHIWGVGPAKAMILYHQGYKNIEEIRQALKNGELDLQKNIRIGVDCYEDFLEKMDRREVSIIGSIVAETMHERFPDAQVCIMGSYRRGCPQCGDVDVLITHPKYLESVPIGVLDWLVESLRQRGHIIHHLTTVNAKIASQMNPKQTICDSYDEDFFDLGGSVSYMGVFSSPVHVNKKRRIDIKFYPLQEEASAMLYFTGSSHFNRSMRLYAKKMKKMHLDDHGLFHRTSFHESKWRMIPVKTERDIFDQLELEFKEPFERDSFDAVKIKGNGSHFIAEKSDF